MHWTTVQSLVSLVVLAMGPVFGSTAQIIVVEGIDLMPQGRASDGRGIMTDAALEAVGRAGLVGRLEFLPWKRAQAEVADGKDRLITGLSRTPEREEKFTWLFPVFRYERAFVTTGRAVASFAEAKASLKQVLVTLGSAQFDILVREGFSPAQLATVALERQSVIPSMLLAGRGDAWFVAVVEAKFALAEQPEPSRFVVGPPLGEATDQYVAASKDCDPELVAKLKKAGAQMAADGTLAKILQRYQ